LLASLIIPYCTIYFDKFIAEAITVIVAGVVPGFFSLKTRSHLARRDYSL